MSGRMDRIGIAAFLRALHDAERHATLSGFIACLAARRGAIASYREMTEQVWRGHPGPDDPLNYFRVAAHLLRRRGVPVRAHKGRGYSLTRAA